VLTEVAPWITSQRKNLAETPALEDYEIQLPTLTTLDNTVRIPPEMMPSEEQALHYFDYYFENVHPYFPVVNKTSFYQQWQGARASLSPLMLEAIFACAALMLGEDTEGHRWLALASSQYSASSAVGNELILGRTRGKLQRRPEAEHDASYASLTEGS
jgi:hypothetical protein